MNNQHPFRPPAFLVRRWYEDYSTDKTVDLISLATAAVQWGADQQLDACVHWFVCENEDETADALYDACRPKHRRMTLKEEALELLNAVCASAGNGDTIDPTDLFVLRDALEALPNE